MLMELHVQVIAAKLQHVEVHVQITQSVQTITLVIVDDVSLMPVQMVQVVQVIAAELQDVQVHVLTTQSVQMITPVVTELAA